MALILRRALLTALLAAAFVTLAAAQQTALDRYVAKPDPAYKYELVKTIPGSG